MKKKNNALHQVLLFSIIAIITAFQSCTNYTIEKEFSSPAISGLSYYSGILLLADEDIIWKIDNEGYAFEYIETPCGHITGLSATQDGIWCIDKNISDNGSIINTVYFLDFQGNLLGSFVLSYPCLPGDLTFDGKYLYISNRYNDSILQLKPDGEIADVIWLDFQKPNGITAVGEYLWVSSDTGNWHQRNAITLYKITKEGAVVNSCEIPADYAFGLAHDENYLHVVISRGNPRIYTLTIRE